MSPKWLAYKVWVKLGIVFRPLQRLKNGRHFEWVCPPQALAVKISSFEWAITSYRKTPPTSCWVSFHNFPWQVCHTHCHAHHVTHVRDSNRPNYLQPWSLFGSVCQWGLTSVTCLPSLIGNGHYFPTYSAPWNCFPFEWACPQALAVKIFPF